MDIRDAERVRHICDSVWRDRVAILSDRGILSAEAALARALYWRLCKVGDRPQQDCDEYAPFINDLVRQYRDEAAVRSEVKL